MSRHHGRGGDGQIEGIALALSQAHPDSNAARSFALVELRDQLASPARASVCRSGVAARGAGIYGVLAFSAAQRRGEMALRLALGARAADVWALVARGGLRMAGIGIAAGLIAALAVTRWLSSMVFGVSPLDTATWVGVIGVVGAITLAASCVPA